MCNSSHASVRRLGVLAAMLFALTQGQSYTYADHGKTCTDMGLKDLSEAGCMTACNKLNHPSFAADQRENDPFCFAITDGANKHDCHFNLNAQANPVYENSSIAICEKPVDNSAWAASGNSSTDFKLLSTEDMPGLIERFGRIQDAVDQMTAQQTDVNAGITEVERIAMSTNERIAAAQQLIAEVHVSAKANKADAGSLLWEASNVSEKIKNASGELKILQKTVDSLTEMAKELNDAGNKEAWLAIGRLEKGLDEMLPNQTKVEARLVNAETTVRNYQSEVDAGLDESVTKALKASYQRARTNVNLLAADVESGAFPPKEDLANATVSTNITNVTNSTNATTTPAPTAFLSAVRPRYVTLAEAEQD